MEHARPVDFESGACVHRWRSSSKQRHASNGAVDFIYRINRGTTECWAAERRRRVNEKYLGCVRRRTWEGTSCECRRKEIYFRKKGGKLRAHLKTCSSVHLRGSSVVCACGRVAEMKGMWLLGRFHDRDRRRRWLTNIIDMKKTLKMRNDTSRYSHIILITHLRKLI